MKSRSVTSDEVEEGLVKKATDLLSKEDWLALHQTSEDWTQKRPNSPEAHYFLGVTQFKRRFVKKAISSLEKCLNLNPEHAHALDQLGLIIGQQRTAAEAVPLHEKATRLAPNDSKLWFNLGVAYSGNAEDAKAEKAFARAMEVGGPEQRTVRRLLAAQINQQKHADAQKLLSDLQNTNPSIVEGITLPTSAGGQVYGPGYEIPPQPVTQLGSSRAVVEGKELSDEGGLMHVIYHPSGERQKILIGVAIGAATVAAAYFLFWTFVLPRI